MNSPSSKRCPQLLDKASIGLLVGAGMCFIAHLGVNNWVPKSDPAAKACEHLISAWVLQGDSVAIAHLHAAQSLLEQSQRADLRRELQVIYLRAALVVMGTCGLTCSLVRYLVRRKRLGTGLHAQPEVSADFSPNWFAEIPRQ